MSKKVPVISLSPLVNGKGDIKELASALRDACRSYGFFYITDHGISIELQEELEKESAAFFSLPEAEKMKIRMELGGKAWRGYFPVGDELTSGKPDAKEGLYLGIEMDQQAPAVKAGLPMHGANLFPEGRPWFKEIILKYMDEITNLGHLLMKGLSLSLGLTPDYFNTHFTSNPLTLFRIFHYPPAAKHPESDWGVGEHTDYGLLTILKQDSVGGLQVKTPEGWIDAPYIPNTFVCNIGDMLDRMTSGFYKSTPHRVRNESGVGRFSFPFFFDPNFDAEIKAIDLGKVLEVVDDSDQRWDGQNVHNFKGSYGEYVLAKVSKVFPQLGKDVI